MKKTLLSLALLFSLASMNAQNLLSEGFDTFPPSNWRASLDENHSQYPTPYTWRKGSVFPAAQSGASTSYIEVDFSCGALVGTLSNWLIAPTVNLKNGDVISFYTRTWANPTTHPDRLELRIAKNATPVDPADSDGVGDYTTLAVSVNPDLTTTAYPKEWTKYSYTVTDISTETPCTIAFRYYVTDGGSGSDGNSDIIGIDTFSVDRALGTEQFFLNNFTLQPNPVNDMFRLTSKNEEAIQNIKVIDINGRIVNEVNPSNTDVQMNISNLTAGVYFVKAQSELGVGTYKIVKR